MITEILVALFVTGGVVVEPTPLPVNVPETPVTVREIPDPVTLREYSEPSAEPVEPAERNEPAAAVVEPVSNVWYALANCESGLNNEPRWDYNGPSGFDGGLQFLPSTWTSFKPGHYPDYAYQATPSQQIAVGKAVARAQGAGAWPSCTAELGITTEELVGG